MKINHHFFSLLLAVWGLLFFSTCNPDENISDEYQQTENNTTNTTSSNASRGGYYHLTGTLADMAITMELSDFGEPSLDGHYFRGFYRYNRYGDPIALNGHLDENGKLVLYEQGEWQEKEHRLEGQWDLQSEFSGEWFSGNGKDVHPFTVQITNNGALQLTAVYYNDSLQAFPAWPISPQLMYEVEWLTPKPNTLPDQQQTFLEDAINIGLLNNNNPKELKPLVPALKERYTEMSSDFIHEMNSLRKEGILDSQEISKGGYAPHYAYNTSMQVYYNTDTLLTVGFTDYSYTGGAHGMYSTQVASYDLKGLRQLYLDDVLLPGYEQKVSEMLNQALRLKYGLVEGEPLSAILFDNTILPNDNFGITSKGIFFVYAPYEVAPYVVGEIALFVSFEKIREFVQEEWLTETPAE